MSSKEKSNRGFTLKLADFIVIIRTPSNEDIEYLEILTDKLINIGIVDSDDTSETFIELFRFQFTSITESKFDVQVVNDILIK